MIRIAFDIETFKYNTREDNPRAWNSDLICVQAYMWNKARIYRGFSQFFSDVFKYYETYARDNQKGDYPVVELWAHNGNKYDNHFLLRWLKRDLGFTEFNERRKDGKVNYNQNELFKFVKELVEGEVLTSRVKTSSNLAFQFIYKGILFKTRDSVENTHRSLEDIGKGLQSNGLLLEKHLKTDFDYDKFDLKMNLDADELRLYRDNIYHILLNDSKSVEYCLNDVIILDKLLKNYNKLFLRPLTLDDLKDSQGLLKYYTDASEVNKTILTNKAKALGGKDKEFHLKYSEYASPVKSQSMYQYLADFYRGGLCMYNEKYLSKVIDDCIVCDINSSYPTVMYNEYFPCFLRGELQSGEYALSDLLAVNDCEKKEGSFYLFNVSCETLNKVISNIKSDVLKKAFVKYRSRKGYVSLNSFDAAYLIDIAKVKGSTFILVDNGLEFETKPSPIKEQIEYFYLIKTGAKLYLDGKKILPESTANNILFADGVSGREVSKAEVDFSKYCMNGIYGLPALSETYDIFTLSNEGKLVNNSAGLNNTERNILFSLVITAKAFYNLLKPLSTLEAREVDEAFVYCDTDSLVIKDAYIKRLNFVLNEYNLGAWDRKDLKSIKIINHKMYVYQEKKKGKNTVKAAGIAKKKVSEKLSLSFSELCEKMINCGAIVDDINSVMTLNNVPVIYACTTEMKGGGGYRDRFLPVPKSVIIWLYKNKVEKGFDEFIQSEVDVAGDVYEAMGYTLSRNEIIRLYNYFIGNVCLVNFSLGDLKKDMKRIWGIAVERVKKEELTLTYEECFNRFLRHTVGRYDNAPLPKIFRGHAVKRYRSIKIDGVDKQFLIPKSFFQRFWAENWIAKKMAAVVVKTKDDVANFIKVIKSAWFTFRSIVKLTCGEAIGISISAYNLVRKFTCTKENIDVCKIFGVDFSQFGRDKRFRNRFFKALYEATFSDYQISTKEQALLCLNQCSYLLYSRFDVYTKEQLTAILRDWRWKNANADT